SHLICDVTIVRHHGSGVASSAKVLGRIEAEGGRISQPSGAQTAVLGAMGLRRVLHDSEAVRMREGHDWLHIRALTVEMDGHDRAGALAQSFVKSLGIERARAAIGIDKYRPPPGGLDPSD